MSKTQEYYDMHQRNVATFRKFPDAEAIKEGIDSTTNAHMFQMAKDHQGMIRDLADAQKRFGKR